MSELQSRITGTEMEWSLQTRASNEKNVYFRQAAGSEIPRVFDQVDPRLLKMGQMLSNGARLYHDASDYPEYATPEDTSFMGTVANEFAGEDILYDALVKAKEAGVFYDFILNKRVVDDALHTWGYHINLSADATKVKATEQGLAPLGPHLATIGLLTGAGAIVKNGHDASFAVAQKVLNLNQDFNSTTNGQVQPLISTREEAHAPKEQYTRVHITSLDANISPWATWMKLGTTSIVLRMMEQGYWDSKSIEFEDDMYKVALTVAHDPDLMKVVRLSNGMNIRPLDIQGEIVQRARKMADSSPGSLTEEEMRVLGEWEKALDDLALDPIKLINRADWVLKRAWLSRYISRNALKMSDPRVIRKDRQWSHMGPEGIGVRYRDEEVWQKWMPKEEIKHAYLNPPTTTRAFARAAFITEYAGKHYETNAEWVKATASRADKGIKAKFDDPFSTVPTSIEVEPPEKAA